MKDEASPLDKSLRRAAQIAEQSSAEKVDIEHVVAALFDEVSVRMVIDLCCRDPGTLEVGLENLISRYPRGAQVSIFRETPQYSEGVRRAVRRAGSHAASRQALNAAPLDLFYAISLNKHSAIQRLFRDNGINPNCIQERSIEVLSGQTYFLLGRPGTPQGELNQFQTGAQNLMIVPHQVSAPVRVEERDGRLIQASVRSSPIDADELDFERWRAPVADGLAELLDADLGPGTNHERLRRRLLALAAALAGTIDDVKANQFRLGYGIESLGDLVGVYRNAADDMPTLNAAVFADVNRLHIQLMLGLSKLAAWSRFQQAADADELGEGAADPSAVGAALAEAEAVLAGEAAAPIVDPELPRSFRWIREAIADPATTTKRMVYGAVKSLENVGSFLGQLALRHAKEAAENVAQGISKRAAAALLLALSGALLHLAGALPTAWPWLKPLLEAAAKAIHG